MTTTEKDNRACEQAQAQLASIREMVAALKAAEEANDDEAREKAETAIHEDPCSVQVRSAWHCPSEDVNTGDGEFVILLCTGGPACRLFGDLDTSEPYTVELQYQDWFTPWESYPLDSDEEEDVLAYCQQFYFGE